ncbi:urease accessory protein UreD [Actibacterium ureilyticum]|uniref:urease accessory protein UreD n=1 Tax=Actibacterium ureilyticum TaxID=1590614 RepID=UPI001FE455BA|nr:urease accessory protein UreD [Actibacterium ureilyticum]
MQRTRGRAAVRLSDNAGRVRLVDLHQSGSAKVFLPRSHAAAPEIVFLNTAGGLTGGDRMRFDADLGAGVRATATTQTAERIYASTGDVARLDLRLSVGAGGRLDWLPQETILFDRARLARRTEVALAGDAACLWVETLVLGRAAMGEALADVQARDHRVVTRDGRPVLIEPAGISPALLADAGQPAGLDGARALATVALVAPGAEDAVGPLRAALAAADGVRGAVTGWDGKAIMRLMAPDAYPLRKALAGLLPVLRPGPLPRVWQI